MIFKKNLQFQINFKIVMQLINKFLHKHGVTYFYCLTFSLGGGGGLSPAVAYS